MSALSYLASQDAIFDTLRAEFPGASDDDIFNAMDQAEEVNPENILSTARILVPVTE